MQWIYLEQAWLVGRPTRRPFWINANEIEWISHEIDADVLDIKMRNGDLIYVAASLDTARAMINSWTIQATWSIVKS